MLELYLNPCLTADGSRVYFTQAGPSPDNAGGYRINADGSGLTRLFSYRQVSALFGKDGSELNRNVSFRDIHECATFIAQNNSYS